MFRKSLKTQQIDATPCLSCKKLSNEWIPDKKLRVLEAKITVGLRRKAEKAEKLYY